MSTIVSEEINDFQRLFYLLGRECPHQFQIEGKNYTFANVPLKRFGHSIDGLGRPRPDPEWLWQQWQADLPGDAHPVL